MAMNTPTYDVFISYRREAGSELAQVVCDFLTHRGYRVFLDVRDMKAGRFDEALKRTVASTPNFVVLLTPDCLQRCHNKKDWFRREIAHALANHCRIVPLRVDGFTFPPDSALPADLAPLSKYHCITYIH